MVAGSYGALRDLPAVAGREGIGEIEAIGKGVDGLEVGMRVRFPEGGVWQEFTCCRAEGLQVVPDGIALGQLAQSFINPPTAFCLLTRLVELPEGAWVLQNAGNSAVGLSVLQMAKEMGLPHNQRSAEGITHRAVENSWRGRGGLLVRERMA